MVIGGAGEETCAKVLNDYNQIIFAGHTSSAGFGAYDICLVRTDENGNFLGNSIVGSGGEDLALAAALSPDHEYILTGYTNSFGPEYPFAVKFDSSGNLLWSRYYSLPGWGEDIAILDNGDFYLSGYASFAGNIDVSLIKCDPNGNVIWTKTFGDSLLNEGRRVIATADGGAILCGITHVQAGGPSDVFVIKTDPSGTIKWSNRYATGDFLNWDLGYSVKELNGNILVGCLSYNQAFNPNPNSPDGLIFKLDKSGNVLNAFAFGSSEYEEIRDVDFLPDGKFCFTGVSNFQSLGQTDLLFGIADSNGTIINQKLFGGNSYDHGLSISAINENDFLLAGYTQSSGSGINDMFMIRTDSGSTNLCNISQASISSASVGISKFAVFDTSSLFISNYPANFNISYQPLTHSTLCSTTDIQEPSLLAMLVYSQNPFSANIRFTIESQNNHGIEINLADISGRIIYDLPTRIKINGKGQYEINTSDLEKGIYILQLNSTIATRSFKLIKI